MRYLYRHHCNCLVYMSPKNTVRAHLRIAPLLWSSYTTTQVLPQAHPCDDGTNGCDARGDGGYCIKDAASSPPWRCECRALKGCPPGGSTCVWGAGKGSQRSAHARMHTARQYRQFTGFVIICRATQVMPAWMAAAPQTTTRATCASWRRKPRGMSQSHWPQPPHLSLVLATS